MDMTKDTMIGFKGCDSAISMIAMENHMNIRKDIMLDIEMDSGMHGRRMMHSELMNGKYIGDLCKFAISRNQ